MKQTREADQSVQLSRVSLFFEEEQNKRALEVMSEGLLILDDQGQVVQFNASACSILGVSEDKFQATFTDPHWKFFKEDGSPLQFEERPAFLALKTGKVVSNCVIGFNLPNGTQRWVRANAIPFSVEKDLNSEGNSGVKKVISTFSDITDLILTQSQLKLAQKMAKVGSWSLDLTHHQLIWSEEHYRIFEIARPQSQQELKQLYRNRIHPEDLRRLDEFMELAQETGKGFIYEHRLIFPDGRIKVAEGIANVALGEQGQAIQIYGTCQDITERKRLIEERDRVFQANKLIQMIDQAISTAEDVTSLIKNVLRAVFKNNQWVIACYWEVETKSELLNLIEIDSQEVGGYQDFIEITKSYHFKLGEGLPGRVLASKKICWISDIDSDRNFPRRSAALKNGLHGGLGLPIFEKGKVRGVLEVFSKNSVLPMESLNAELVGIATRIGQAFEKLRAQQEIRIERKRFEEMVQGLDASSLVSTTNMKGEITHVNDQFIKISGYSKEELIGANQSIVNSRTHPPEFFLEMWNTILAGRVWHGNICNRKKDGSRYWVNTAITRTTNAQGESQYMAISFDITDQKNLSEHFEVIFKSSPNPIIIVNDIGILDCNQATLDALGFTKKEDLLMKHPRVLSPEYQPDGQNSMDKSLEMVCLAKQNGSHRFEWSHRKTDGTEFPVEILLTTIQWNEEPVLLAVWNDLTEKRKRDLQLIQTMKMASLGEMAGGVAHEINNPLAIIQGKAEMLLKYIQNGKFSSEDGIKKLTSIINTTDRIGKIISGLRSFSRDAKNDEKEVVSPKVLLESVFSLCFEKFKSHGVKLELGAITEVLCYCRVIQIEQVLLNLLNNSFDAIENLAEKWVRVDVRVVQDRLEILVTDSGIGISSDVVEKLMQPFFTTKIVGKGTGLGLSISKGIVEGHQGTLRYNGSTGNTQFIIELPLR